MNKVGIDSKIEKKKMMKSVSSNYLPKMNINSVIVIEVENLDFLMNIDLELMMMLKYQKYFKNKDNKKIM